MIERTKYILVRPSTDVVFRDISIMTEKDKEFIQLPVRKTMTFSDDELTRTMVVEFDTETSLSFYAILDKFKDVRDQDHDRRVAAGIQEYDFEPEILADYTVFTPRRDGNRRVLKQITKRPSKDLLFNDHSIVKNSNNAYHDLPIDVHASMSPDMLTRTRISSYDRKYDQVIANIREKYKDEILAESTRQVESGFLSTVVDITDEENPVVLLDQLKMYE